MSDSFNTPAAASSSDDSKLSEIQKLIRLKRYEQPTDGMDAYCKDVLFEFQQRQRVEMLRRSPWSVMMEKVASFFWGFGTSKLVWGGAAAYASVMMFAYLTSDRGESGQADTPKGVAAEPELLRPHDGKEIQPVTVPRIYKEL